MKTIWSFKFFFDKSWLLTTGLTIVLSFLSGLLTFWAFPNTTLVDFTNSTHSFDADAYRHYLAFISLVPLFYLWQTKSLLQQIIATAVFTLTFYLFFLFWLTVFHPMALPIVVTYLVLIHLLILVVFRFLRKQKFVSISNLFLLPILFTLFEYLRHLGFLKFPYGVIAYSQYAFLPFIQIIDITGIWAISFFIYLTNTFFSLLLVVILRNHQKIKSLQLSQFFKESFSKNQNSNKFFLLIGGAIGMIFCLFLVYGFWQLNYRKDLQN